MLDQPITELAQKKGLDLDELDHEAKMGGWTVFQGKKYTSYGVATAAVRLLNVILSNLLTELPVPNFRELPVLPSYCRLGCHCCPSTGRVNLRGTAKITDFRELH